VPYGQCYELDEGMLEPATHDWLITKETRPPGQCQTGARTIVRGQGRSGSVHDGTEEWLVSCPRGSNGPVVCAGGGEQYRACETLHRKVSLGSREPTRATSNDVDIRDVDFTGRARRVTRPRDRRVDAVSIGRDPMSHTRSSPCGEA
jgi:hypothetical protein